MILRYSPSQAAVLGEGSDDLGIPRSRAQRDHERAYLYEARHGRIPRGAYVVPEGRQRTTNHKWAWAAANLLVADASSYELARAWWISELRAHLDKGILLDEGPNPGSYIRRYAGCLAAVVTAAADHDDRDLYSLALTVWSVIIKLELMCEGSDGRAYMACVRGNESRLMGWSEARDVCRDLVLGRGISAKVQRLVQENPHLLMPPLGTPDHGEWLQKQIAASPWMEAGLVWEVAERGFRVDPGAVTLPRVLPGRYRLTVGDGGHRTQWVGPVQCGWGGALIDGVDVQDGVAAGPRVISRSWLDRGLTFKQSRSRQHGLIDPLSLPGSREGMVYELSATSPAPRPLNRPVPESLRGAPGPPDPPVPPILAPDRAKPNGELWEELIGEVNVFRDKRQVRKVLGIMERLRDRLTTTGVSP